MARWVMSGSRRGRSIAMGAISLSLAMLLAVSPGTGALAQDDAGAIDEVALGETEALIADLVGVTGMSDSLPAFWAATFPTFSDQPYHGPAGRLLPVPDGRPFRRRLRPGRRVCREQRVLLPHR